MTTREHIARPAELRELCLVNQPNWTGVAVFGILSGLHFTIAIPAFFHQRWEGYLSLMLAVMFALSATAIYFTRCRLIIDTLHRQIRVRSGFSHFAVERFIPFGDVHAVRVTDGRGGDARIEVLCDNEDIECPPTSIPHQEALYLAITMGVELIKVKNDPSSLRSDRML